MNKKIVGFGDSFVFGSELANNNDGQLSWLGQAARQLNVEYETYAVPGCGNENISRQILTYFSNNPIEDTLAVINWTWCVRWDFFLKEADCWITLGPTCVPGKLEHLIGEKKATELIAFYCTHAEQSESWNVFRSLQSVYAVQSWLRHLGVASVQTYMDISMIDYIPSNRVEHYLAYKDQLWPTVTTEQELLNLPGYILDEVNKDFYGQSAPEYVNALQKLVKPYLETFEGQTFLDWSYHNNFPVTKLLHPLEQAHQVAAKLWQDRYRQILKL